MNIYKPTWLYIKQHNQTGLKYFGKTVSNDPVKYKGSGKWWSRHLLKYGNDVTTVWCQLFESAAEIQKYALQFSVDNNIVESAEWANLKLEDGLWGGGVKGIVIGPHSEKHNKKISASIRTRNAEVGQYRWTEEQKQAARDGWTEERKQTARDQWTEERRMAQSERAKAKTGIKHKPHNQPPKVSCPHCHTITSPQNFARWHGDKCKLKG